MNQVTETEINNAVTMSPMDPNNVSIRSKTGVLKSVSFIPE